MRFDTFRLFFVSLCKVTDLHATKTEKTAYSLSVFEVIKFACYNKGHLADIVTSYQKCINVQSAITFCNYLLKQFIITITVTNTF